MINTRPGHLIQERMALRKRNCRCWYEIPDRCLTVRKYVNAFRGQVVPPKPSGNYHVSLKKTPIKTDLDLALRYRRRDPRGYQDSIHPLRCPPTRIQSSILLFFLVLKEQLQSRITKRYLAQLHSWIPTPFMVKGKSGIVIPYAKGNQLLLNRNKLQAYAEITTIAISST